MTQRDRVLQGLQRADRHGITAVDFLRFPTIDGGPPITRVAARIEELRKDGYTIDSSGTRDRCAVYVLKASPSHAGDQPATSAASEDVAGTLFNPAAVNRPLGAYDDLDEVAAA